MRRSRMSLPTFDEWRKTLPPVVAGTLVVLWTIYFIRIITGWISASTFALNSNLTSFTDLYRFITGPMLHADGLHIALNSLAFARVGVRLENSFGTFLYFLIQLFCTFFASAVYVMILFTFRLVSVDASWTYQSTVGFSACLFALFVIEVETAAEEGESLYLFGRLRIPPRLQPWAMILFIQLFLPNVSFIGHVSGALLGLALSQKLGLFVFPNKTMTTRADQVLSPCISRINGSYKTVYYRPGMNPFEISAQKSLVCSSLSSSSILPMTQPPTQSAPGSGHPPPPQPPPSNFPSSGGHRLGSS